MKSSTTLLLFTDAFPFGKGEQFLETEVKYLAEAFKEVHVFPYVRKGEGRPLPENCKVVVFERGGTFSVKKLVVKRFGLLANVFTSILFSSEKDKYKIKGFSFYWNTFLGLINEAEKFEKMYYLNYQSKTVCYSYWFGPWGDILTLTTNISGGRFNFITRIHGYDYDVDQRKDKFIPFRFFQMNNVRSIYAVSNFGLNKVKQTYPSYKNIFLQRLGVTDSGINPFKIISTKTIVSCSSLIPLKRVHLIPEILKNVSFPVNWVHFGDGDLRRELDLLIPGLPKHVQVEWKGHVSNQTVLDFYKENAVDLFINVSELEGIPVSIMEAISFGIPVVGCNICGVPEIVTHQTGILLEKDFHPREAAERIEAFISKPEDDIIEFRKRVKEFWRENFNAEKNYRNFINNHLLPCAE